MPNVMKLSVLTIAVLGSQFTLANEPWSQDRQWLLGDWNGKRQQLEQQGYKFTASIMSQAATNLDGGYNDSNTFENAAQLSLGANFDLEKIAGWKDTTASLVVTKRDGNALTLERIKDPRSSQLGNAQEIYGRGKIWRLSQAWVKKGFVDNTVQVKFGRMGMSEETLIVLNVSFRTYCFAVGSWENQLVQFGITHQSVFGRQTLNISLHLIGL
ncbi:carbohydrate porin [Acinetobacter baumannii]|nr:carbohydrate porin [Acinetobacter baumannii]